MTTPLYAILGATGSTGSAILRYLHFRPEKVNINLYARSESKLQTLHPYIHEAENIKIFTGSLSDPELLKSCLRSTTAIFCTVAQNINEPKCSIAQQTAHAVVTALDSLRAEAETETPQSSSSFTCPQVIFLSSASLSPIFLQQIPGYSQPFLKRAMYHVYLDLELAIHHIESQVWIPLTCAEPGALVKDVSRGWELSETEITGLISYDDLGRGMVQMAEEEEDEDDGDDDGNGGEKGTKKTKKWIGKKVGLKATGFVRPYIWPLIKFELSGILAYFLPSIWMMGRGYLWA